MILNGRLLQYVVFCAGFLVILLCGLHYGWSSPFLPQLLNSNSTLSLTNTEGSWVATTFLIGSICGSIISAIIFDIIGRKQLLLLTAVSILISWLILGFASKPFELFIARFLAGASDGSAFLCVPLYLAEISDPEIRGFLITGISLAYFVGAFLINLLGNYISLTDVAFICVGLSLVTILICLFAPDSPHFYIIKGDVTNAKVTMQRFRANHNVDASLDLIKDTLREQKQIMPWLQLFRGAGNRKSFFIIFLLETIQQCSGIVGVTFHVQTLFEKAAVGVAPIVFVSVYFVLQILTAVLNAFLIDKVGRRPLLMTSLSMVVVALAVVSIYFSLQEAEVNVERYYWFSIVGFLIFVVGYTFGLHNVPIVLAGELFPLHVKAVAVCVLNICYALVSTTVSVFFQYGKDEFGVHVPFIVFTVCSLCGLPYIYFCVPETKMKTLEEIQCNQTQ